MLCCMYSHHFYRINIQRPADVTADFAVADTAPLEAEFLLAIHGTLNPKPKHPVLALGWRETAFRENSSLAQLSYWHGIRATELRARHT
jgi:hypothetical protein